MAVPSPDRAGNPERVLAIVFKEDERQPQRPTRDANASGYVPSFQSPRRSCDGEAINGPQARRRASNYDLAIGYRTLSFQTSESRSRGNHECSTDEAKDKPLNAAEKWAHLDEHRVPIEIVLQRHRTSLEFGLSSDAATKRLQEYGFNTLPEQKHHYTKKVLGYVFGGFCSVLWVGVIVFFLCWKPLGNPNPQPYNLGLAVLVIIVILLQALFSAFEDWSTARTMNSILDMVPSSATVLREGVISSVATRDLVPGDVVQISIGDKVPADLRLVEISSDTTFERSAMAGESEDVEASLESTDKNILESLNMAWMGTTVTNGSAKGVVVFTGYRTVMGTIATATTKVKDKPTAIQQEVTRFVRIIVGLTLCLVCLILFSWVGWLRVEHPDFLSVVGILNNVMGCVVAFIPEGMPVGVALTLMLIARRMRAVNVLPKSLATVETLGCVQVICSDKTGTLTKNEMNVASVGFVDCCLTASEAIRSAEAGDDNPALVRQSRAARLCNASIVDPGPVDAPFDKRAVRGNATDGALLQYAEATGTKGDIYSSFPQVAQVAFNSKNKFMLTLHEPHPKDRREKGSSAPQQYLDY